MLQKVLLVLFILLLIWLAFFHRTAPAVGRRSGRRVRDVKRAGEELLTGEEVEGSPLARYEHQAGKALTARVLSRHPLADDIPAQERVLRIGRAIAAVGSRHEIKYRFAIIEGAEAGAMAIPGGSVFLTRRLVELCGGDDSRLAGVIGHEVAHIDRRHAARSFATTTVARAGVRLLTFGRGALLANAIRGLEHFLQDGYSRDRELEADRVGADLAARAGFSRDGLVDFLRSVSGSGSDASSPFFRSHPPIAERLAALESRS